MFLVILFVPYEIYQKIIIQFDLEYKTENKFDQPFGYGKLKTKINKKVIPSRRKREIINTSNQ